MGSPGARQRPTVLLLNWRDIRNPEAGGAEVHLHEVARRLVADGFRCFQYSAAFPGAPREEGIDGVTVRRRGHRLLFNFTAWARLRGWVRETGAEIVLDDSNKVPFFAPWLIPVPVLAQIHHLFGRVLFREAALPMALYVLAFEKLMPFCYRNTQVTTGSESSRRELLRKGFRFVDIAPEGADLARYRLLPDTVKKKGQMAYVGRIKRYKGLDVLLEALALLESAHPEARLVVAGSGDDVPRLRGLARALGLESKVRFLGFVSEEEKVRLYNESEVALNSSLKEGWGLTSIEANACGTPVVATDVPGLCDSVKNGETGLLVPFGDAKAFAAALGRLLSDPVLKARMRESGLAWAARHTWEGAYAVTRRHLLALTGREIPDAR